MKLPLVAALVAAWPMQGFAQGSLEDAKGTAEMMVASASACSRYLKKPELVDDWRGRARERLVEAGMSEADADGFLDGLVEAETGKTYDTMQAQVGCEMIDIKAINVE